MSVTQYAVNNPLSNKLWAKKLNVEALKETYSGTYVSVLARGSPQTPLAWGDLFNAARGT
ncbi:hypothetical protein ACVIJ6_005581 [Bradyrhizobium sp. USDA 4369]